MRRDYAQNVMQNWMAQRRSVQNVGVLLRQQGQIPNLILHSKLK